MKQLFCIAIGLLCASGSSQESVNEVLDTYNDHSVEYIYGDQLAELNPAPLILDTREKEEYDISHLKNAIHVGFRKVNISKIEKLTRDKNTTIVVYCSIGVRSERIGKQLIAKAIRRSIICMVVFLNGLIMTKRFTITIRKLQKYMPIQRNGVPTY